MGTAQFWKRFILLSNFLLLLLFLVDSSDAEFKVKIPLIANNNGTRNSNKQVNKEEQLENSNGVFQKDLGSSNISESLQSKDVQDQEIHDGSRKDESKNKGDESGNNLEGLGEVDFKSEVKRDGNEDSNGSLIWRRRSHETTNVIHLTYSPDLSLLIRNKGSEPVTVTITAPEFVQLEETKVQLQQKEDKKVKVTVTYEALDSLILLTTENTRCTLDFKELIPRDSRIEARYVFKFRYFSNLTKIQCMVLLTLSAFLVFGSAWMCSGMCKKLYQGNGYQTINMELPLSVVSKLGPEKDDSWDDSWDDHWDDEEAPKTPSLPVTPNLSSRGLASRRLNKEAWKD
uniref:DUF7356 domain-containing protein n=1 Tax=Chenopodium quinoa TaxID=63459 RepID=A0A803LWH9_CHEQI